MKKTILSLAAVAAMSLLPLQAQVRIVNSATNVSVSSSPAFIDASSNTTVNGSSNIGKGLIFPRVDLSAMTSFPSVTAGIGNSFPTRFDGMIVYNTATSGTAGVGSTSGTLSPGYWYYENKSSSNTGGTWKSLGTIAAAAIEPWYNAATSTGATANTQDIYQMGKVGIGTTTPNSMLHTNGSFATRYIAVSADTPLDATHHTVNAVHNSGTVTLTLPPVSGITGRQYVIQNNNSGTTNVVVSGGGTIEGLTTFTMNQVGQTAQLIAGNAEWQLVTHAIKSASVPSGANIYTADGTLNSNRTVTLNNHSLNFADGPVNITGTASSLNVSGQIQGSAVHSTGDIQADGNLNAIGFVKASYINSTGNILAGGQVLGATLRSSSDIQADGNINAVGFVKASYVNSTGNILAGGQVQGATIRSSSDIQADGNLNAIGFVKASYVNSTGNILASGQIQGATIRSSSDIQADGNLNAIGFVKASYVNSTGNILASGQIQGATIRSSSDIQADGNLNAVGFVKASYINSTGSILANGQIQGATIRSSSDIQADGNFNAVGFVKASYINSTGNILASGQVQGATLRSSSDIQADGNINAIGFLKGSYINSTGSILASGQVQGATLRSSSDIQADGNINAVGFLKGSFIQSTGDVSITGISYASNHINTSDVRLKSDIKPIKYGLLTVMSLDPKEYQLSKNHDFQNGKPVKNINVNSIHSLGFLAQDIYKIVPEVTYKPADDSKEAWGVDYGMLVPILTKAIQEQQIQIEMLKKEVRILQEKITR